MTLRNALMAAALVAAPLVAAPGAAQAQKMEGVYIGLGGGINWITDSNIRSPGTGTISSDVGFVGLGSVGYAFGNGVRLELEGSYRYNTVSSRGFSGNIQSYGPMVNAFYDFDAGWGWVTPYIGAGVGYQFGTLNSTGTSNSSDGVWAAQGMLGAAWDTSVPGLAVTTEFRVMGTLERVNYNTRGAVNATDNQVNLSGLVGIRYTFGQTPPPAPAAVPAPAPARTYLVFFDWDKADLTPRAKQIIADAAQASTKVAVTRIDVGGHADNTGTPAYNMGLSMRRANNVAAELVRLGVPRNIIDINAFGDTKPLVQVARQTREPQNRRVEIVLK